MVITFLESVLSCTPILFVKFGQKAVGAIDFTMRATAKNTGSIKGNVNFYNINQWDNPYNPSSDATITPSVQLEDVPDVDPDVDPDDKTSFKYCKPKSWDATECQDYFKSHFWIYPDHVYFNTSSAGELALVRTKYYNERLEGLEGFWGFFPRTYLPQT